MAFTMDVELPVKEEVIQQLEVVPEVKSEMAERAAQQVDEMLKVDLDSMQGRRSITDVIEKFGMDTMQRSSQKNNLLKTRIVDLSNGGGETTVVAKSLDDLNNQLKDLDPSAIDFLKKGWLGEITSPIRKYFRKYERADKVIDTILQKLKKGKTQLKNDNTTLEIEQENIRNLTKTLNTQVELGTCMDSEIERRVEFMRGDPKYNDDMIKFVQEEVQFPLRQRVMDLQALQAVNYQSYFAIEIARKNNLELIRSVDRIEMLTVTALRTAVMLASSLYHQKIVIDCVNATRETTNALIESTSKMIKEQGVEIQKQATEATIDPNSLRVAFENIFSAMDDMSNYKVQALPKMREVISEFQELATEGARRMQRIEAGYSA